MLASIIGQSSPTGSSPACAPSGSTCGARGSNKSCAIDHGAHRNPNASLALLPRLLTDADFRARVVSRVTNPLTRAFFEQRFNTWRDDYREQAIDPVLNKIDAFLFSPAIFNVIGQAKSTLHFEHAMAKQRVVIANLARGIIGETPSNLMGALLLARVQAAGMARAALPLDARPPFHIVIDEVQLFGTEVIKQILSEARKYHLSLTMATQFMAGLSETTRAAVMGNVAALVVFRVGHEDAIVLAPEFDRPHQAFNPYALRQLPRGEAMVRVSSNEGELVSMHPDPARAEMLITLRRKAAFTMASAATRWRGAYSACSLKKH